MKSYLRDNVGLPAWTVLVIVGCLAHIMFNSVLGKPTTSGWGLLAPLGLGIALESYEIWSQYRTIGLFAPGNDPLLLILFRHGLDVLLMLAGPLLIVAFGAISTR